MPADLEEMMREIKKISPVTKFACASTLGLTLLVATNPFRYYPLMTYNYRDVIYHFKIWQLWTSFFVGTPTINLFYEVAILQRSLSALEAGPFVRRSSDLVWQMLFACAGILGATRPLNSITFLIPLTTCFCYLAAATAPSGSSASFMGLITLPADYLPYFMIFLSLLTGGPGAAAQAVAGALVGFVWYFLVWREAGEQGVLAQYGRAPEWLRKSFGETKQPINGDGHKKGGQVGTAITLNVGGAAKGCCGQRAAGVMG